MGKKTPVSQNSRRDAEGMHDKLMSKMPKVDGYVIHFADTEILDRYFVIGNELYQNVSGGQPRYVGFVRRGIGYYEGPEPKKIDPPLKLGKVHRGK